jgi:hypothetical protein
VLLPGHRAADPFVSAPTHNLPPHRRMGWMHGRVFHAAPHRIRDAPPCILRGNARHEENSNADLH